MITFTQQNAGFTSKVNENVLRVKLKESRFWLAVFLTTSLLALALPDADNQGISGS